MNVFRLFLSVLLVTFFTNGYSFGVVVGIELLEDSVHHPYDDVMIYDSRLPDGKYTLIIEGFDTTYAQSVLVSIRKDE